MPAYFYAPGLIETETIDGAESKSFNPGSLDDDGETIVFISPPLGTTSPKYDRELNRFVLACPDGFPGYDGWEPKTVEEVNSDYPGLIGG